MTPQPKRRHSHSRSLRRRSQDALTRTHLVECPTCHKMTLPHRVCVNCGSYRSEKVLEVES